MIDLLDLKHLEPISFDLDPDTETFIITCRSKGLEPPAGTRRNGAKEMDFRDFALRGIPAVLRVRRQRYITHDGQTIYEELPDIDATRRITLRFLEHLQQEAVRRTFADAALTNGVEETFVRRIFADYAKSELADYSFPMPRVLGMDETYLRKGYRFVLGDVENRRLLDMRSTRVKSSLDEYVGALDDRHKVEVICQDMYDPYRRLGRRHFPKAIAVVDKFHVVKMANEAVEMIRRSINAELSSADRVRLKGERKLLLMRHRDLKGKSLEKVEGWLEQRRDLALAYWAKEAFYDIYDEQKRAHAEQAYDRWAASLPQEIAHRFTPILTAMKRWRPYIFHYFEHPYTNAYVESLNGLIGEMQRLGRGYTFDILRAKALLKFGPPRRAEEVRHYKFCFFPGRPSPFGVNGEVLDYGVGIDDLVEVLRQGKF